MNMNGDEPAFPCPKLTNGKDVFELAARGLTKRDFFAGMALAGILANPGLESPRALVACEALEHADALVAELSRAEQAGEGKA